MTSHIRDGTLNAALAFVAVYFISAGLMAKYDKGRFLPAANREFILSTRALTCGLIIGVFAVVKFVAH